jgi:hypothetical protein
MEVSCQLHALVSLVPWTETLYSLDWRPGGPQSRSRCCGKHKQLLHLPRIEARLPVCPARKDYIGVHISDRISLPPPKPTDSTNFMKFPSGVVELLTADREARRIFPLYYWNFPLREHPCEPTEQNPDHIGTTAFVSKNIERDLYSI